MIGISTNLTAWIKRKPIPGHWKTVSVIIENAIKVPIFIQAVQFVDIPIMSAYLVFIAFVFVMINFIVDILYYFIDPRIRVKAEAVSG